MTDEIAKFFNSYKLSKYRTRLVADIAELEDIRTLDGGTDDRLEEMFGHKIQLGSLHKKRFERALKELDDGTYYLSAGIGKRVASVDRAQQSNSDAITYGWINLSVNNHPPTRMYCVFKTKKNQIFIYTEDQIDVSNGRIQGAPYDIIWMCTCEEIKPSNNNNNNGVNNAVGRLCVQYLDHATGILYTLEPCDNGQLSLAWYERIQSLITAQIVDLIWGMDISSAQNFNRFLKNVERMTRIQAQQLPQISLAAEETRIADEHFKRQLKWLESKDLDAYDRRVLKQAITFRQQFWKYLSDTRNLIGEDFVNSAQTLQALQRWIPILSKKGSFTEIEQNILKHGITQLKEFVSEKRTKRMRQLRQRWIRLSSELQLFQAQLQAVINKWQTKANHTKSVRNNTCFVAALVVIGTAFAAALAAPAAVIVIGVYIAATATGVAIGSHLKYRSESAMVRKCESMKLSPNSVGLCQLQVDNWLEGICLMRISLLECDGNGNEGQQNALTMLTHLQNDHLLNLCKAFKIFRDRCQKSMSVLRQVHENVLNLN